MRVDRYGRHILSKTVSSILGYNPIVLVQDDEEWGHLIHGYSYMV